MRRLLMCLAVFSLAAFCTSSVLAQPPGGKGQPPGKGQPGKGGPGGKGGFVSPMMKALDADGDGTLSEDEIKNASKALLSLDKNKDGKLTADELRPAGFGGGFGGKKPGEGKKPGAKKPPEKKADTGTRAEPVQASTPTLTSRVGLPALIVALRE